MRYASIWWRCITIIPSLATTVSPKPLNYCHATIISHRCTRTSRSMSPRAIYVPAARHHAISSMVSLLHSQLLSALGRVYSYDFITDLPESEGYDSVFIVVDRLTKMSHFVPCHKTTTAPEFTKILLDHVICLHGIPDSIVSDRGSIFTSQFWTALSKSMNLTRRLSTAFHPQTDGQTERMNQTVEQYLRIYCNYHQDDWSELLSLAEFSYNNAQHASIGCSPFYANYGYNPRFTVDLHPFSNHPIPAAEEMAKRLKSIHEDLTELIKVTQNQQARYYDAKHKRVEYNVGDKVWLMSSNIHTQRLSKELDWKCLSPYPIAEKIGTRRIDCSFLRPWKYTGSSTSHFSIHTKSRRSLVTLSLLCLLSSLKINSNMKSKKSSILA